MVSFGKGSSPREQRIRQIEIDEKSSKKEVPRIWKINPSFKHINNLIIIARSIFLVVLVGFFMSAAYLITFDLSIMGGAGIVISTLFLFVFRDHFYLLRSLTSFSFKKAKLVNPFRDLLFLLEGETSSAVYISNKKDLMHTGLAIFRIKVIPENIHAPIDLFIKALSGYKNMVSFTYQIVQTPLFKKEQTEVGESIQTNIYFCIHCSVKGTLSRAKFRLLRDKMVTLGNVLQSNFAGNFHHFQIVPLSGRNLINALRTYFFKIPKEIEGGEQRKLWITPDVLIKALFSSILLLSSSILLSNLGLSLLYTSLITITLLGFLIYLWWRELLFLTLHTSIMKSSHFIAINPFKDIVFFRYRGISDSLFAYIDNTLLVGTKMFNLALIRPSPYVRFDKFLRGIMNQKIYFGYTCINSPVSFEVFYKKYLDYLNLKTFRNLLVSDWRVRTKLDGINWLGMRSGIWQTILTLSVCEFTYIESLSGEVIEDLEEQLHIKSLKLYNAFNTHFFNCDVVQLRRQVLLSGVISSVVKNKDFTFIGTHLNYLIIQGKLLISFIEIVDELKKGITTRIASEFNTPLKLKNSIVIGDTINTEVLEKEIPFGFTEEQLTNLLIVNGTYSSRELLAMKIVSQLVEKNKPSLVFDFRGSWSKILKHFEGTPFENEFLYFKLGTAFSLDPLKSDIPYDPDNLEVLDYIFDAYALAFQKQKYAIDIMRNAINKNPELDMESFNVQLINQNKWENPASDTLLALFRDLTTQDLDYLHISTLKTGYDVITFQDFIKTNKTVIIDLSIIVDLPKLVFFTFIIISKIIHFLKRHSGYVAKYIFIPHIDVFFKSKVIEQYNDYGKVYKFLDPLIDKGFGLICGANQMYYLHPNFVKYFENIVSFRTTDKNDIGALMKRMNLRDMHGTGIYSRSRKEAYQTQYLENMKSEEALVKRSDIYQSFPVCFEWKDVKDQPLMKNEEIIAYMDRQGYNLRDTERLILEQIKKTIFEKDLGIYGGYIPEVKKFLESIGTLDQIGNLYEKKLKKELITILYPKASRYYKDKSDIKRCRDEIFSILIKQGYIVENHPKTASGSESLRTSFSVGPQYKKALEDEYESNQAYTMEAIEEESPNSLPFVEDHLQAPRKYIIEEGNVKKALMRVFSDFNYEVFTIHLYLKKNEFKNALKLEHEFIQRFLTEIYRHYYNSDERVTIKHLHDFIEHLSETCNMPFTKEELNQYLEQFQTINFNYNNIKIKAKQLYKYLETFFNKLHLYLYRKSEEETNEQ
ncbi:MAG: hypothetical protein ACFFAG_08455 [Promethearchaeota archaeon]